MKKLFLAALGLAAMLPVSAKTVTFVGELSTYKATDPNEEVVVVSLNWKGRTIYANGIQVFMGDGKRESAQGGLYVANTTSSPVRMQFYADNGVTINKITFVTFGNYPGIVLNNEVGNGILGGETVDDVFHTQVWEGQFVGHNDTHEFIKFGITDETHAEWTRFYKISVEYDGEQQRCKMPIPNIGNECFIDVPITFENPEPDGKIMYSLSRKATYENGGTTDKDKDYIEWDGTPIQLSEPSYVSAYVVAPGKDKSALYYNWIFPAPEEAHVATFDFTDPASLASKIKEGSPRTYDPASASPIYPNCVDFSDNGITLRNTTHVTAENSNTTRFMATNTYGYSWQLRHATTVKTNGAATNSRQRLVACVENEDNQICGIIFVLTQIGQFGAAQKESVWDKDLNKPVEHDGYSFPDVVDFENEAAENYKTKVIKSYNLDDSLPYIRHWEPAEDYYATEDYETNGVKKVIFEQYDASKVTQIERVHVFYYGDAPEAGSSVGNLYVEDNKNAPIEYYNLQGVRVSGDQPGLYIVRQGSKTKKVIVK